MNPLLKNKFFIAIIVLWTIGSIIVTINYQLEWWHSFLFILAFGGLVFLLDPLLTPIVVFHNKKIAKIQKVVDQHIAIARKAGKKDYLFGDKKQHVIWAKNKLAADKIWSQTFTPQQRKSSNQLYYISADYNNVIKK